MSYFDWANDAGPYGMGGSDRYNNLQVLPGDRSRRWANEADGWDLVDNREGAYGERNDPQFTGEFGELAGGRFGELEYGAVDGSRAMTDPYFRREGSSGGQLGRGLDGGSGQEYHSSFFEDAFADYRGDSPYRSDRSDSMRDNYYTRESDDEEDYEDHYDLYDLGHHDLMRQSEQSARNRQRRRMLTAPDRDSMAQESPRWDSRVDPRMDPLAYNPQRGQSHRSFGDFANDQYDIPGQLYDDDDLGLDNPRDSDWGAFHQEMELFDFDL